MFEINRNDNEAMEYFIDEGIAYKDAIYDFTFEGRYLIYHAPMRHLIVYLAIDMKTELTTEVCTRKEGTYLPHEYKDMIPMILSAIKYTGDKRYINTFVAETDELIDTIFRLILPRYGYNVREEQIALCKKMYKGFTEKTAAVCEAEVGTGKTLAYLVASLAAKKKNASAYGYNRPVTITTSNIELQNALVSKEIPLLSRMLMEYHIIDRPLTVALRKGKEHYFCKCRYNDYVKKIGMYPNKYATVLDYFEKTRFEKTAFDLDSLRLPASLKNKICVVGKCGNCPYRDECRYNRYISSVMDDNDDLDFQVTNHNLYITSKLHTGILRESDFVIIDEAHKLKEAARDMYGECIGENLVVGFLNWSKCRCKENEDADTFAYLRDTISKENKELFESLRNMAVREDSEDDLGTVITIDSDMVARINTLAGHIRELYDMCRTKGRCEVNGKKISESFMTFTEPGDISIWISIDENDVASFCCCPKNVGALLASDMWDKGSSHILTSGTMSDGEDFAFFKRENGLDRISNQFILETSTPSPFEYDKNARLYIPDDMPNQNEKEYIKSVSDRIVQIVEATNGHTAILFTSYKMLKEVYDITSAKLANYSLICMTRSNKTAISDFKKSKNAVLFASGPMWEGVDCIGDCLSSVIIVKLPFPLRTAAMEEKKNACGSMGEFINKYVVPEMIIKLRQGVGRLIRSESDTGVISILDPRASENGAYHDRVLSALDKYPTIGTVDEIAEFIKSVKTPEYFESRSK